MAALVDFQKTRWFSDGFRQKNPEIVDSAIEIFLANNVEAYAATCRMLGACDVRSALPSFRFPVAIIVGEEDYFADKATAGAWEENGEQTWPRRQGGMKPETPVRNIVGK